MENIQSTYSENTQAVEPGARRGFLMKSAFLLTALGVSGTTSANAQEKAAEGKALKSVLAAAYKSGDIKAAVASDGQILPPEAKTALMNLTPADLKEMQALDEKLSGLRAAMEDGNNGGNGM
jgi:hypothetical protein